MRLGGLSTGPVAKDRLEPRWRRLVNFRSTRSGSTRCFIRAGFAPGDAPWKFVLSQDCLGASTPRNLRALANLLLPVGGWAIERAISSHGSFESVDRMPWGLASLYRCLLSAPDHKTRSSGTIRTGNGAWPSPGLAIPRVAQ